MKKKRGRSEKIREKRRTKDAEKVNENEGSLIVVITFFSRCFIVTICTSSRIISICKEFDL